MATITIDPSRLVEFLKTELQLEEKKAAITGLAKIDWNPFDDDGDEHDGAWSEMKNNGALVWNAIIAIVDLLETIVIEGTSLTAPQKKKIAVELVDDVFKLPFFLEPFDNIVIGMLVDAGVAQMKKINWGLEQGQSPSFTVIPASSGVWKEIG